MGRTVVLVVAILLLETGTAQPRQAAAPYPAALAQQSTIGIKDANEREQERLRKQQEKRINQNRYKEIRRDADKLVELANQLKRYVDNANEHTLSLEVVRKAEEIEKLAKDVKSRMKENYSFK